MRIINCFKIVADLEQIRGNHWTINENRPEDPVFVKKVFNPYDESALELSLKMADQLNSCNSPVDLAALTIDSKQADLFLKRLFASGFNQVYRINNPGDSLLFQPVAVADILTAFIRVLGLPDLIVMGMQSSGGDNAKTALLLAENLSWPCITGVTGFNSPEQGLLTVQCLSDQGSIEQTLHPPCLLAVGNAPNSHLRVPTLKSIKTAGATTINQYDLDDLKLNPDRLYKDSDTQLIGLCNIDRGRAGKLIEADTVEEKAAFLYNKYLKSRLNNR
jgi:electron transfer flavoprotein alpha/beta subunit